MKPGSISSFFLAESFLVANKIERKKLILHFFQ